MSPQEEFERVLQLWTAAILIALAIMAMNALKVTFLVSR